MDSRSSVLYPLMYYNSNLERETREKLHALLTPDISTKPFQEVLKMRVDICMDFFCKLVSLKSPIQGVSNN